jgi:hypothetical protein
MSDSALDRKAGRRVNPRHSLPSALFSGVCTRKPASPGFSIGSAICRCSRLDRAAGPYPETKTDRVRERRKERLRRAPKIDVDGTGPRSWRKHV